MGRDNTIDLSMVDEKEIESEEKKLANKRIRSVAILLLAIGALLTLLGIIVMLIAIGAKGPGPYVFVSIIMLLSGICETTGFAILIYYLMFKGGIYHLNKKILQENSENINEIIKISTIANENSANNRKTPKKEKVKESSKREVKKEDIEQEEANNELKLEEDTEDFSFDEDIDLGNIELGEVDDGDKE